jgi:hypothetical protein
MVFVHVFEEGFEMLKHDVWARTMGMSEYKVYGVRVLHFGVYTSSEVEQVV